MKELLDKTPFRGDPNSGMGPIWGLWRMQAAELETAMGISAHELFNVAIKGENVAAIQNFSATYHTHVMPRPDGCTPGPRRSPGSGGQNQVSFSAAASAPRFVGYPWPPAGRHDQDFPNVPAARCRFWGGGPENQLASQVATCPAGK